MKKNIVILTSGLSGSSVLSALLAKDGYWVGEQTIQKPDYDTWENAKLVELNKRLLQDIGFNQAWTMHFKQEWPDQVTQAAAKLDSTPYRNFIEHCSANQPWLWKDPRLWLTIRYWQLLLPKENLCYLVIHRDPLQSWISTTLRRQIQTFRHAQDYEQGIHRSIFTYLKSENAAFMDVLYEDLICRPGEVIKSINSTTGTVLTVDDLVGVFRGRLYKKQHGVVNLLKAAGIYLKNYRQRVE